ncbi:MAG: sigma factor-like helix-turn-helix DNA-binding protein [Clostridium sp.]
MDSSSYVEYLLKNRQALNQQLEELKEMVESQSALTEEDIIEELTFKKSQEEKIRKGRISDKVPSIALVYQEVLDKRSRNNLKAMNRVIEATERELIRLDRAITSLPEENKRILDQLYVKGRSYKAVAETLAVSESTLHRYRKRIIEQIAVYFSMEQLLTLPRGSKEYKN